MNNHDGKNYNKSSMTGEVRMTKFFCPTSPCVGFSYLEKMTGEEQVLLVVSCLALSHHESVYYVFI